MTSSSAVRSFAITLAIAITIVGPGASGFTIHRRNSTSTTTTPTDLPSEESLQLQVKEDIKIPNDIANKNEDSNKTTEKDGDKIVTEKFTKSLEVTSGFFLNITPTTAAISSTTENFKIPTISSDTVEVFDSIEDTKVHNASDSITNNSKETIKLKESQLKVTEKSVESKQTATIPISFNKTQSATEFSTIVNNITTESGQTGDNYVRNIVSRSIFGNEITTLHYNVTQIPLMTETPTEILTTKAMKNSDVNKTEFPLVTTDSLQTVLKESNVSDTTASLETKSSSISVLDVSQTTTEAIDTKVAELIPGKYPKYTTIIRKRTTMSEETTVTSKTEDDEMKAETSNTEVNFEKAFNITPIPSLEKLRDDLLSNKNQPIISGEITQGTEKVTREVKLTTPYTVTNTESKKLETIETKRAGYIDNSESATTPVIALIREKIGDKVTEMYGTVADSAATETASPDNKKVSGSESQSQLAEDAIQEEFLKEEALNNQNENAIRYQDYQTGIEVVKLNNSGVSSGTGTEDSLSVQPIERIKTTLYTPSPNYKPMKKIDVQPAKPFVRDPDDNSWRNESISSLGIVFKPKNSTKSFKEVLKNKTQTELNSLIERTRDDVPDLRVRLEKIAEVRKTKKKKMNKDGDVIYTDYEENSAETSSTPKPEPMSSLFNSAEIDKMLTPSNSHLDSSTKSELEMTTPMTTLTDMEKSNEKTTKILDIFSRLGLDALTTQKPRKLFNIAEYYDTTDEYDADYVTMSKLDLKKFTMPPRTTRPSPLSTKPIEPYVPERRPTVQYFPPREPVNVNNVDKDFERKVNLFTFKDHPRIEPRPPFVTVPPLTIATVNPESRPLLPVRPPETRPDMRSTLRPTDFMHPRPEFNKNYYLTNSPTTPESEAFLINSERLDRGSYVIKHYKDFLNAAVDDEERSSDFLPYHSTQPPLHNFATEMDKQTYKPRDEEEDYDTRFRKEVLSHFVDNFNQNSERFKVDFPILYNNSVVHRKGTHSPASSRTFLKRLYNEGVATRANGLIKKPCEPNCEMTVELSPAYELHYYVPNQEEREEQEPRSSPAPYRYGL